MIKDELAAKLTAYALGEGTPEERREAEALIAKDPEAKKFVDEMRALGGDLKRELDAESLPDGAGQPLGGGFFSRRSVWENAAIVCLVLIIAYLPFRKKIHRFGHEMLSGMDRASDSALHDKTPDEFTVTAPTTPERTSEPKTSAPTFHQIAWEDFKNARGKPQFQLTEKGYLIEASKDDLRLEERYRQKLKKCVPADNYREEKVTFSAHALPELTKGAAKLRLRVLAEKTTLAEEESSAISGVKSKPEFLSVTHEVPRKASEICVEAVLSKDAQGKVWFDRVEFTAKPLKILALLTGVRWPK